MKLNKLSPLALCLPIALLAGCGSAPPTRVTPGGVGSLTSAGADVRDIMVAADELTQSLLASAVLDRNIGHTPVVEVSQVRNDTDDNFDTDQVSFKITTGILNSGKAQILATDATAKALRDANAFRGDEKQKQLPDYVLYAKLMLKTAVVGNTREKTYTLQFKLADATTGNNVWLEETDFAKRSKRSAVGF